MPQQQNSLAVDSQSLLPAQPPSSTQTVRAVVDAREAESMLLRTRPRQTAYQAQNTDNLRAQRALSAYGSLVQDAERDYVSSVLGIDEYA